MLYNLSFKSFCTLNLKRTLYLYIVSKRLSNKVGFLTEIELSIHLPKKLLIAGIQCGFCDA